jgi:hypothetical protein
LSPAGYGGVTSFVVIVPDTRVEAAFYRDIFDLDEIMHHRITGPAIEKAVGLPTGAALDMRLMGREAHIFGRMELIAYDSLKGTDRFALARAPALGTLHCGFAVESMQQILGRAQRAGLGWAFCSRPRACASRCMKNPNKRRYGLTTTSSVIMPTPA